MGKSFLKRRRLWTSIILLVLVGIAGASGLIATSKNAGPVVEETTAAVNIKPLNRLPDPKIIIRVKDYSPITQISVFLVKDGEEKKITKWEKKQRSISFSEFPGQDINLYTAIVEINPQTEYRIMCVGEGDLFKTSKFSLDWGEKKEINLISEIRGEIAI